MFDLGEIRRLLDAFEASDWDEIHLVADGVDLYISSKHTGPAVVPPPPAAPVSAVPAPQPTVIPPAPSAEPNGSTAQTTSVTGAEPTGTTPSAPSNDAPPATTLPDPAQTEGMHAVVSPSPGIFWRSPAPGEPPFVEVGQAVDPATPIGIVEVMKLMNQVLAEVRGTVRAVLVENGAHVERDQPIVLVEPRA